MFDDTLRKAVAVAICFAAVAFLWWCAEAPPKAQLDPNAPPRPPHPWPPFCWDAFGLHLLTPAILAALCAWPLRHLPKAPVDAAHQAAALVVALSLWAIAVTWLNARRQFLTLPESFHPTSGGMERYAARACHCLCIVFFLVFWGVLQSFSGVRVSFLAFDLILCFVPILELAGKLQDVWSRPSRAVADFLPSPQRQQKPVFFKKKSAASYRSGLIRSETISAAATANGRQRSIPTECVSVVKTKIFAPRHVVHGHEARYVVRPDAPSQTSFSGDAPLARRGWSLAMGGVLVFVLAASTLGTIVAVLSLTLIFEWKKDVWSWSPHIYTAPSSTPNRPPPPLPRPPSRELFKALRYNPLTP